MKQKIILLDIESTGTDDEDRLCEVASKAQGDEHVKTGQFKPPLPIKFDAMAIHHITNEMVEDDQLFIESDAHKFFHDLFNVNQSVMVAHNVKFDAGMLKKEGIETPNMICTMKVMRHFDKKDECLNYQMQYLRYKFGLKIPDERVQSHNAADDVIVLEALFDFILEQGYTIEKMLDLTNKPQLLRTLKFGKHKGEPCSQIPYSYWNWMLSQDSFDEDVVHTRTYHMKRLSF